MAQYEHEGPCDTTSYSSQEIYRADQALSEDVARGDLQFLQTMFEYYPLEAVPNVWEGDEGMMGHVPDFPVPPCIALPEQLVSEAAGSIPGVRRNKRPMPEIRTDGNLDINFKRSRPEIRGDCDLSIINSVLTKKKEMKSKFWVNLANVYASLESIQNTLLWKVITKYASEKEKDKKTACHLVNKLHLFIKKIKSALDNAAVIYSESKYNDQFQQMSPSRRLKFKNRNALHGEIPDSLASIVEKFMEVRNQIREFVLTNCEEMSPFHKLLLGIMKCIRKKKMAFSDAKMWFVGADGFVFGGGARSDMPGSADQQGGGGHPKKRKSEHVGDAEASNGLYKEEVFWKKVVHLKTVAQKVAGALSMTNDVGVPSISNQTVKSGSAIYRQMSLARKNIVTINKTLEKLKEEMQANNYEDKKPFSADDLMHQGIDLTPDNSLGVIEAMLNKLQEDYLRVQGENFSVLDMIGYGYKVGSQKCVGKNIKLVRICAHSQSSLRTPGFNRVETRPSEILHKQNDPGQDSQKNPDTDGDYDSQKPVVEETGGDGCNEDHGDYDSQKPAEETGDDGSNEDYSDISKTVNSLSFFMSNLEPGALTVSEATVNEATVSEATVSEATVSEASFTPATEEFIEQEKQYWDRLQTLLLKINKVFYQVEERGSRSYSEKFHMRNSMKIVHQRIKEVLRRYESLRDQGCQAGYCMHVTYQEQGQLPDSFEDVLVKSLDQIKDRIYAAYKKYMKVAKKLGMPFSYKLC